MKWIILVFVNFLPETGQWKMFDYRHDHFLSKAACEEFIKDNRQDFIDEANRAYFRNDKGYIIGCPTLDKFNVNIVPDEWYTENV